MNKTDRGNLIRERMRAVNVKRTVAIVGIAALSLAQTQDSRDASRRIAALTAERIPAMNDSTHDGEQDAPVSDVSRFAAVDETAPQAHRFTDGILSRAERAALRLEVGAYRFARDVGAQALSLTA